MTQPVILASASEIRSTLLSNAGLVHEVKPARIDEDTVLRAMQAVGEPPRNIADALADAKAAKISRKDPDAFVIGSDQVLSFSGDILQKAATPDALIAQLTRLQCQTHTLWSAAVIYQGGEPQWRHVGQVNLTMRAQTPDQIASYVAQHWDEIQYCVGGYRYEAEGIRLFSRVEGDYFHILGIPLLEVVNYCMTRGILS